MQEIMEGDSLKIGDESDFKRKEFRVFGPRSLVLSPWKVFMCICMGWVRVRYGGKRG